VAFDVYVGTLTRFYRRDWENVAQRMAREQGIRYKMIHAGGEPEAPPSAQQMHEAISAWQEFLSRALEPHNCGPIRWDEGDHMPYFTDRPAWEGYSALLVWAAHTEHPDLEMPAKVPQSWNDDPAYQRSISQEFKSRYTTILRPELWLPTQFPFCFESPTLVSEKGCIGSVFTLKEQLDRLWDETASKLEKAQEAVTGTSGTLENAESKPDLVNTADFGLSVFRDLATKACENRLPMLLSF
jgi:hypothetical protein